MFATDDTIVAIATPAGRGGIGVVRISGPDAPPIAQRLMQRSVPLTAREATFGRILEPETGAVLDQVVATWFAAPHSYTGEDVVELSVHGSPVVLARLTALAIALGARLAEPGEFTLRAYLQGRIDLPQAEAVADLVDAVTPLQARAALDQLEGTLTGEIRKIDEALFDLTARLEASLDFPEEGFHFVTRDDAMRELDRIAQELARLAKAGRAGRVIREGRTVVIAGLPNAGKSSLFNALAGASRAIVTNIPGTTRDLLIERIDVEGLALTLVDTAGLRDARDAIEAEGVRRAEEAVRIAALTLVVIDGSAALTGQEHAVMAAAPPPRVIVQSKSDLPAAWQSRELTADGTDIIAVSANTGEGLDELKRALVALLTDCEPLRDPPAITNIRHLTLVDDAHASVERGRGVLADGATEELVVAEIGRARSSLEEITGRRTVDDLLVHIFTRFCIGK